MVHLKQVQTITDILYGTFEVEAVLGELLTCDALLRLKNIHQGGGAFLVNQNWSTTRYEHSVGVMILIRLLGGTLEEQILGLLHDISHTAFSHVIDYLMEEAEEDYHEKIYEEVIESSQIPSILNKYGIDAKALQTMNSLLLDSPLPNLCADRIDYTLRDLFHCKFINKDEIHSFINALTVKDNEICLTSQSMAEWFTKVYYREVIDFFMDSLNIYANDALTRLLKQALKKSVITLEDFKRDDAWILDKITASQDQDLLQLLKQINSHVILIEDDSQYDIYRKPKPRMVDPLLCIDGMDPVPISTVSTEIQQLIKVALKKLHRGTYLKVIPY